MVSMGSLGSMVSMGSTGSASRVRPKYLRCAWLRPSDGEGIKEDEISEGSLDTRAAKDKHVRPDKGSRVRRARRWAVARGLQQDPLVRPSVQSVHVRERSTFEGTCGKPVAALVAIVSQDRLQGAARRAWRPPSSRRRSEEGPRECAE